MKTFRALGLVLLAVFLVIPAVALRSARADDPFVEEEITDACRADGFEFVKIILEAKKNGVSLEVMLEKIQREPIAALAAAIYAYDPATATQEDMQTVRNAFNAALADCVAFGLQKKAEAAPRISV